MPRRSVRAGGFAPAWIWLGRFLLLLIAACQTTRIFAHDPGLSAATIRISSETIIAELAFARADIELLVPGLDANHDGRITQSDIDANKTRLQQLARNALKISTGKTVVPIKDISFTLDARRRLDRE